LRCDAGTERAKNASGERLKILIPTWKIEKKISARGAKVIWAETVKKPCRDWKFAKKELQNTGEEQKHGKEEII